MDRQFDQQHLIILKIRDSLKRLAKDGFNGRHFEAWLIIPAISWYLRYPLICRYAESLFAERGFEVAEGAVSLAAGQFRTGVSLLAQTLAPGGEQVMPPLQEALYSRCSGMIETSGEPHAAHSKRRIFLTAEKGVDGLSLRDSKRMGVEYRHIGLAQVT